MAAGSPGAGNTGPFASSRPPTRGDYPGSTTPPTPRSRANLPRVSRAATVKPHKLAPPSRPSAPPVDPLVAQAQAQGEGLYGPQQSQLTRRESDYQAVLKGFSDALANTVQGYGGQVNQIYGDAATAQSQLAGGFTQGLRDQLGASSAPANAAILAAGGTPGADVTDAAANTLYGLGGYLPSSMLASQGHAFGAAAALLPTTVLGEGRQLEVGAHAQYEGQQTTLAAQRQAYVERALKALQAQQVATDNTKFSQNLALRKELLGEKRLRFDQGLNADKFTYAQERDRRNLAFQVWKEQKSLGLADRKQTFDEWYRKNLLGQGDTRLAQGDTRLGLEAQRVTDAEGRDKFNQWATTQRLKLTQSGQTIRQNIAAANLAARKAGLEKPHIFTSRGGIYAYDYTSGQLQVLKDAPLGAGALTAAQVKTQQNRAGGIAAKAFNGVAQTQKTVVYLDKDGNPLTGPDGSYWGPTSPTPLPKDANVKRDLNGVPVTRTLSTSGRVKLTYQEAMREMLTKGVPLAIAQKTLNQYWKTPGETQSWENPGEGRPVVPYQDRGKGGAARGGQTGSALLFNGRKFQLKGTPYVGSHTLFGNWESDNAVDLAVPYGTPIYSPVDGVIGSRIGALPGNDPHLAGLRINLAGKDENFYLAHLSRLSVKAGDHVKAGQLLGYSGRANGLDHLHIATENGDPRDVLGLRVTPSAGSAFVPASFRFGSQIGGAAKKYKVDPLLIAAVIQQESSFDPKVTSSQNAQGLMQVLPSTAGPGFDLFDPGTNIDVGTKYLAEQLRAYHGNVRLALAAYNAGPGAVAKYGGVPPYAETSNYIRKVLGYYQQYKRQRDK